jgi:hypothetical protein
MSADHLLKFKKVRLYRESSGNPNDANAFPRALNALNRRFLHTAILLLHYFRQMTRSQPMIAAAPIAASSISSNCGNPLTATEPITLPSFHTGTPPPQPTIRGSPK